MHPDNDANPQETYDRIMRVAEIYEFEREVTKANIEFSRLPVWTQAAKEGDYLPEDSGMTIGDKE